MLKAHSALQAEHCAQETWVEVSCLLRLTKSANTSANGAPGEKTLELKANISRFFELHIFLSKKVKEKEKSEHTYIQNLHACNELTEW